MDAFDKNLYTIAELLHKTVKEIEGMSYKEYCGWVEYLNEKNAPPDPIKNPNLLLDQLKEFDK